MRNQHVGFTLVELLVVITIIVILLSLLAPAMDQAIYQAELAMCAAQQDATVKGLHAYALNFKRSYPHRRTAAGGGNTYPWQLNVGGTGGVIPAGSDDRPALRVYVDLGLLVDPLCKKVRLDEGSSGSDTWVYSSYALWFGWRYTGQEGMTRMGNRLTWTDTRDNPPRGHRVNWLITDWDSITPSWPMAQGSHPDRDGLLRNEPVQAGGYNETNPAIVATNQIARVTISRWASVDTGYRRGGIEMNAASADGSVSRYNDVAYDRDPRMASASSTPGGQASAATWLNMPLP